MIKSLYFFVTYTSKKKENEKDINFLVPENSLQKPECIHIEEEYKNQTFYYEKIFKVNKSKGKGKKANNYYFEFVIDDDKYIVSFDSKGSTFVYDVILEKGKKFIDIRRKINQNNIEYHEKMDTFIEALKKEGEEKEINELYKETIELYSKKKGFSLLIALFLEIYQKKELCHVLLEKFKEMNKNPKDPKDIEKNMDRKSYLKEFTKDFSEIKYDELINNNGYNTIDFCGIMLCYLNFYDYEKFSSMLNELFTKKQNDLFEILLLYNAHFKNPINQDLNFFNKFIEYTIVNKKFSIFECGLSYIKDLSIFINVIENTKKKSLKNILNLIILKRKIK